MELDAEGGASFEQLKELIRKECDKRDKNYRSLEQKYNKLQEAVDQSQQQKNMPMRGPRGASNKKKSQLSNQRRTANQRGRSTSRRRPRPSTGRNGKAEGTNNDATSDNLEKQKRSRRSRSQQKKRPTNSDRNKSRQPSKTNKNKKFDFVADPKKTLLHNASSALANIPTWYYFSRPSHLAFHDFTQQKQPPKNLRSLLGLRLKFIPTPHLTNIWTKLEKTTMPNFQRTIHLRFYFAGTTNTSNEPYDPKMYVRSNWTPPHWTKPPVVLDKHLEKFSSTLDKLLKKTNWKAKPTPISDTRFKTITTTTGLPHLPLRQKPWAGDHRTSQLHQDHNEGSPAGWTYLPTPHQF